MLDMTAAIVRYSPGNSFVLGLHAFALEERGRCDEAVRVATAALMRNSGDAWAVHALAHALYEMAGFDTGITRLPGCIHPCRHVNWFRDHLVWHLALLHYARGDYGRASTIARGDRKSTRLNSSHRCISYAVFCLKKKRHKNKKYQHDTQRPRRASTD